MQPLISSPANSETPIPTQEYRVGMDIAYIYNKEDLVLGNIIKVNHDETFDLQCYVPQPTRKIEWNRAEGDFKVKNSTQLINKEFLKAKPCNPATIFIKADRALDRPITGRGDGVIQTHVTEFISGGTTRVPRFGAFHTSIIGKFFDPSLWYYQLRCWRAAIEIRKNQFVPEETKIFPNPQKQPFYTEFKKAFNRYFREYHEDRGKWNRVELIAIHPEDVELDNVDKDRMSEIEQLEARLRALKGE